MPTWSTGNKFAKQHKRNPNAAKRDERFARVPDPDKKEEVKADPIIYTGG